MKFLKVILSIILINNLLLLQSCTGQVKNNNANLPLTLSATILLPEVSGRIDHLAYDSKRQFVYVAALGNNTVEVVDLKNKKVVHSVKGLGEPQGIRYMPENDIIVVANGNDGMCDFFKADTYQKVKSVKLNGDADNVRYDAVTPLNY
jgi:YVTN family beta-propeller protein